MEPREPREPRSRTSAAEWELPAALVAVVAAAAWVFRGALVYFFAQDDFAGLARATGVLPRLDGSWRWLSGQLYFDVMHALVGLHAGAYHAASLVAFAITATLLVLVLRRRVAIAAALVGAAFFATHPALFTALYSISGIGEILALGFALGAILAARGRGPARWAALPLYAASLLSKETLLLLPVAIALDREPQRPGARRGGALDVPLLVGLAAVGATYLAVFLARDVFGVWRALPASAPYALAFDGTVLANALTYAGWAANFTVAGVRAFSDAVDTRVFAWGVGLIAVLVAGACSPPLVARGWRLGVAILVAFLLPVLPLAHHTYHYYLLAPLAGLAMCVAAAADVALEAIAGAGPRALALALAVVVALAANGGLLVRKCETMPFTVVGLRADPTVDRMRIAANVRDGLAAANLPPGAPLAFWSPGAIVVERMAGRDLAGESYWERNVRAALDDATGLRVLFPELGSLEFTHMFRPRDESVRWALYAPDGHLEVMSAAEVEAALRAGVVPPRQPGGSTP